MTSDSYDNRQKIAEWLGFESFEEIVKLSFISSLDADDTIFRLIAEKINK